MDSTVYRFTDCDKNIEYDGDVYFSLGSGTISALEQTSELNPDNFDFEAILTESGISKTDVIAGLFDFADIKIHIINRESTADGTVKLIRGKLGQVQSPDNKSATIEFRSLTQLLSEGIGRTYTHECDADLGDARCGVTLASYTHPGTITYVENNGEFRDLSQNEVNDYFSYGLLTWTSGNNSGISMEVKEYLATGKIFKLMSPMPFGVQVGDGYSVYKGCDKTKTACKTYDNILNFRGFAEIPGPDWMYRTLDVNKKAGLHD
jgi:uncharacterized phage protein (TIGR02218 family)